MESTTQFPFLKLPPDLRRMVYEFAPEIILQPLLSKSYGVYYEDARAPTSLLVANKLIYSEIKAWFDVDTRFKMPLTLIVSPQHPESVDVIREVLDTLSYAQSYDKDGSLIFDNVPADRTVNRTAIVFSVRCFRIAVRDLEIKLAGPATEEELKLRDFIHVSLLKMERGRTIQIRYLVAQQLLKRHTYAYGIEAPEPRRKDASKSIRAMMTTAGDVGSCAEFAIVTRTANVEKPLSRKRMEKHPMGQKNFFNTDIRWKLPLSLPTKEEVVLLEEMDREKKLNQESADGRVCEA